MWDWEFTVVFLTTTDLVSLRGDPPRFLSKRKSCRQSLRNDMNIQAVVFNSRLFLQSAVYFPLVGPEFALLSHIPLE